MREENSTEIINIIQLILLQCEVKENGDIVCILGWDFFLLFTI